MDFYQLKYFKTLANVGNLSKTADELDLSQPALSRSILRLEDELGVPLFERKSRGVVLNRYGEIFLKNANQALQAIEQAKQEINNIIDPFHGSIFLGFIEPLGPSFIPDVISAFQKEKPNIHFELTQDSTKRIIAKLKSSDIEIGFCAPQEPIEGLSSYPIMNLELQLLVPKDHRLADRSEIDLSEVANDSFILYRPNSALHDIILRFCNDAGFHPNISFEAFNERTVAGLVGVKLGVALTPFIPGLDTQKISIVKVRKPHCLIGIHMVWRTNGYSSPALSYFKTFLENNLQTVLLNDNNPGALTD